MKYPLRTLTAALMFSFSFVFCTGKFATASLVTNGTFDTDLSGWTIDPGTTTGVTWISGTAHLGRPGTPGVAIFEQAIDIPAGATGVAIDFDYEWQVNPPSVADTFTVDFVYESTSLGTVSQTILSETSAVGVFGSPTSFSDVLSFVDLDDSIGNGLIRFTLNEVNAPVGTRIELDNVVISAIPEASTMVTWAVLMGLGAVTWNARRRNSRA